MIVRVFLFGLALWVGGCGTTPPRAPDCEGEYTPINTGGLTQGTVQDEARSGH